MGSSSKKRAIKKADFQKPKLKVGKARPKPANATDTSFKSKSIVIARQSLSTTAPSSTSQFAHHVSLLGSHSNTLRRDSLAYLTTATTSRSDDHPLPQPTGVLLLKLAPRIYDSSTGVRMQLLKLLNALPENDVKDHVDSLLPHIRVGLTHLSIGIRTSTTDILQWLLEVAGPEAIFSAGGWAKTLKTLLLALGWTTTAPEKTSAWTQEKSAKTSSAPAKTILVLATFLRIGLSPASAGVETQPPTQERWPFPLRHTQAHMIPRKSNPFGHLNLFGPPRDEEGVTYEDVDERRKYFVRKGYMDAIEKGVEYSRREGGEVGRAAAQVRKAVEQGMRGFESER